MIVHKILRLPKIYSDLRSARMASLPDGLSLFLMCVYVYIVWQLYEFGGPHRIIIDVHLTVNEDTF